MAESQSKIILNGNPYQITEDTTISQCIEACGYQANRIAVEVNGDIIPKSQHPTKKLMAGDVVEVVTFVGGG